MTETHQGEIKQRSRTMLVLVAAATLRQYETVCVRVCVCWNMFLPRLEKAAGLYMSAVWEALLLL